MTRRDAIASLVLGGALAAAPAVECAAAPDEVRVRQAADGLVQAATRLLQGTVAKTGKMRDRDRDKGTREPGIEEIRLVMAAGRVLGETRAIRQLADRNARSPMRLALGELDRTLDGTRELVGEGRVGREIRKVWGELEDAYRALARAVS